MICRKNYEFDHKFYNSNTIYISFIREKLQNIAADYFLFCFFIFNVFIVISYLLLKAFKKNEHLKILQSINIWIPSGRKHIIKDVSICQAKVEWLIMLIAHLPNFYKNISIMNITHDSVHISGRSSCSPEFPY